MPHSFRYSRGVDLSAVKAYYVKKRSNKRVIYLHGSRLPSPPAPVSVCAPPTIYLIQTYVALVTLHRTHARPLYGVRRSDDMTGHGAHTFGTVKRRTFASAERAPFARARKHVRPASLSLGFSRRLLNRTTCADTITSTHHHCNHLPYHALCHTSTDTTTTTTSTTPPPLEPLTA